jgi:transposase
MPGSKKVKIDESTLRRLYVKEGKSIPEIAKAFNCGVSTVSKKVKQFGLKKRA